MFSGAKSGGINIKYNICSVLGLGECANGERYIRFNIRVHLDSQFSAEREV